MHIVTIFVQGFTQPYPQYKIWYFKMITTITFYFKGHVKGIR